MYTTIHIYSLNNAHTHTHIVYCLVYVYIEKRLLDQHYIFRNKESTFAFGYAARIRNHKCLRYCNPPMSWACHWEHISLMLLLAFFVIVMCVSVYAFVSFDVTVFGAGFYTIFLYVCISRTKKMVSCHLVLLSFAQ